MFEIMSCLKCFKIESFCLFYSIKVIFMYSKRRYQDWNPYVNVSWLTNTNLCTYIYINLT